MPAPLQGLTLTVEGSGIVRFRIRFAFPRGLGAAQAADECARGDGRLVGRFYCFYALRLREGFELPLFTERTGLPPSAIAAGLAKARDKGLLDKAEGPQVRPSDKGFDFLSDLQEIFL